GRALLDLAFDRKDFLEGRLGPPVGGRGVERRRVLQPREARGEHVVHSGDPLLAAYIAGLALRLFALLHLPSPLREGVLGVQEEPQGEALRFPAGEAPEPYTQRKHPGPARDKSPGHPDLEKVHAAPADQIGRRAGAPNGGTVPSPPVIGAAATVVDYIVDYIEGFTLRHWPALASRKRDLSGISNLLNWRSGKITGGEGGIFAAFPEPQRFQWFRSDSRFTCVPVLCAEVELAPESNARTLGMRNHSW